MNWWEQTELHLAFLNHKYITHIRAYGNWGGKKYWIPSSFDSDSKYFHIAGIVGKHFNDNISVGIADYNDEQEPMSCSVVVFDFDRADKDKFDGKYLSEMAKEIETFRNFMVLKGFSRGSLLLSGTGFHLYYSIPTIYATPEAFQNINEFQKWAWEEFVHVANPSHIVADIDFYPQKIMRLAGTYNRKAGRPRLAKWIDYQKPEPDRKMLLAIKLMR